MLLKIVTFGGITLKSITEHNDLLVGKSMKEMEEQCHRVL